MRRPAPRLLASMRVSVRVALAFGRPMKLPSIGESVLRRRLADRCSRLPVGAYRSRCRSVSSMPRIFRTQRRAAALVIKMHETLQHLHESATFVWLQRRQNQPLRGLNRRLDVADQSAARGRDIKRLCASIGRAAHTLNQLLLFQTGYHIPDGGPIESNDITKRCLIYPRMIADGEYSGILNRRDFESSSLIHKESKRNLLKPANEMAGFFVNTKVVLWHQSSAGRRIIPRLITIKPVMQASA